MIAGVGTDLVEVARIAAALRRPGFAERILTAAERAQARGPEWVAGRWAAKEAAFKCLPSLRSWQEVEVLSGPDGAPSLRAAGGTWHVSITHTSGFALAFAVLEV